MALYRLHKNEWEKQLRPLTEAYKVKIAKSGKHNKRKREGGDEGDEDDDEVFASSKRGKKGKGGEEFPGGGKQGISSGLGLIIKKNGVRIDQRTGKVMEGKKSGPRGRAAEDVPADTGGSNWWDE
jgi:RNA exonuclease 4